MRIKSGKQPRFRRGSLALEALLLIPIYIVFALIAIFVLEAMVFRQDLAGATRMATASVATGQTCRSDESILPDRQLSLRRATITCRRINDERGLQGLPPHFGAMELAYRPHWPGFWRDIDPQQPLPGHVGEGQGAFATTGLNWLHQAFGHLATQSTHRRVDTEIWTHQQDHWRSGMDRVSWSKLAERNTHSLFPNVFPSN